MHEEVKPMEPRTHSLVAEVSREIVRTYARFYGRGPTKAKTVHHGDLVLTVLEEIFTKAELVLVGAGQFRQVRAHRQAVQDEVEPLFCQVVEEVTGRKVHALLSQVTEEGIASEVFVLEPTSDPAD